MSSDITSEIFHADLSGKENDAIFSNIRSEADALINENLLEKVHKFGRKSIESFSGYVKLFAKKPVVVPKMTRICCSLPGLQDDVILYTQATVQISSRKITDVFVTSFEKQEIYRFSDKSSALESVNASFLPSAVRKNCGFMSTLSSERSIIWQFNGDVFENFSIYVKFSDEKLCCCLCDDREVEFFGLTEDGFKKLELQSKSSCELVLDVSEMKNSSFMGKNGMFVKMKVNDNSLFEKYDLANLEIRMSSCPVPPDFVLCDGVAQSIEHFFPFGELLQRKKCDICINSVSSNIGERIFLEFLLDCKETNFIDVYKEKVNYKLIMKAPKLSTNPSENLVSASDVSAQFFNGTDFVDLDDTDFKTDFFVRTLNGRCRMSFIVPKRIVPVGGNLLLRFCINSSANVDNSNRIVIAPSISNLRIFPEHRDEGVIPVGRFFYDGFGIRDIDDSSELKSALDGVVEKTAYYICFDELSVGEEVDVLFVVSKPFSDLSLEYFAIDGFQKLSNTRQDSFDFITFRVTDRFTKTSQFGIEGYWIRAYTSDNDDFSERLISVSTNCVMLGGKISQSEKKHFYDLAEFRITPHTIDVDAVSMITPLFAVGSLKSSRVLTKRDFEFLFSNSIMPKNKLNINEQNNLEIFILFENAKYNNNIYFSKVNDYVRDQLRKNDLLGIDYAVTITPPDFVEYSIKLKLADDCEPTYDYRYDFECKLRKFFDIFVGGFDGNGWNIGEFPTKKQIVSFTEINLREHFLKAISITVEVGINVCDISEFEKMMFENKFSVPIIESVRWV